MNTIEQLKQLAVKTFAAILPFSADSCSPFKMMTTIQIDGEVKPVLLAGVAHGKIEDGHIMAVLNPDPDLADEIKGGVGYAFTLKEMVTKRCDAAVDVWVDGYQDNAVSLMTRYQCRTIKPAKFVVA